ncbi:MAG: TM0106 family RecB-like putative nuclease [Candidatus Baltobacteraceae bacterium]
MQLLEGVVVVSATDVNNYIACEHLTTLDLKALRGELERPTERAGEAELLAKLGDEHERSYLRRLLAEGRQVTTIERGPGRDGVARAAAETEAAMARGDEVIYQATFFDGVGLGYADFLRKIPEALVGGRWAWHYEVEDTKLARHTEPYFLLQLAYYSEHVARIQGAAPANMHVVLGNGLRETFRVEACAAYYRSVRARFLARLAHGAAETYPVPVSHCGLCVWSPICEQRREKDDHLSLVANMTRQQTARLNDNGIPTLRALAAAGADRKPPKMQQSTFERLRRQARLQKEQRVALACGDAHPYRYEFLESGIRLNGNAADGAQPAGADNGAEHAGAQPAGARGFYRLPEPSPGDVFFDMEGDPYFEIGTGLEYLFGAYTPEGAFHALWGCDRSAAPAGDRLAEKRAFEAFVDFVMERRQRYPAMHVYHYASYEKTALQALSLRHATREAEVDVLLREERLVDLYAIVRQAIVVGQPSYSIKMIEEFYGKRGAGSQVKAGSESILRFEEWLALRTDPARRDDGILADLERYNEYDCVSTHGLREWLLELRARAARQFGVEIPPFPGKEAEAPKAEQKFLELKAELDARIPADFDPAVDDPRLRPLRPFFLARHMLEYHWREHKPEYWRFYDRCETYREDPGALLDDSESIVGLEFAGETVKVKQSLGYAFHFPAQLHKLDEGECYDLVSEERAGKIVEIEDGEERGRLVLLRGRSLKDRALPAAITRRKIVPASTILDALARFARALLDEGARCRYRAAFDVLTAASPRLRGVPRGSRIAPASVDEASLRALCDALDDSYLFVQGPPGSGKTYLGARLIVDLLARGRKVGITANSHKAIHNLLDEVESVASARRVDFAGAKKCTKDEDDTRYHGAHFRNVDGSLAGESFQLVAGTAWAFGPQAMDQQLDYLFIDEAGQMALPHAIAALTSAKNAVLLGDPLQLPQVTQTQHPGDLGASVLEHLLGHELRPVAAERGILLTDSYRMHPGVCRFISELLYEGKLHSAAGRERQEVRSPGLSGAGLRYLPVEHAGNSQRSEEEAARVAAEIEQLLRGTVRDVAGATRPLAAADVIVVTPYNAQVRCIGRVLTARGLGRVEVGTVDKFQGREAYVVFFSTAASSPEDAPRGISFVFDRQRFNVAISRARALAVMVGSPALLVHHCTSVEQVQAANGVCRFIEEASSFPAARRSG